MASGAYLEATPLSKKRGVNCSGFVAYCVNVAKIKSLFPNGLPESILSAMRAIENYKIDYKISKLFLVPDQLILSFEKEVKRFIRNKKDLEQLMVPIKGKNIGFFSARISQDINDWEFVGHMCYVKDENGTLRSYAIDDEAYKFILSYNKYSSMLISSEVFKKITDMMQKEKESKVTSTCNRCLLM